MFVLFIVLNDDSYLDDILTSFVDLGVKGATILDSQGMGSAIVNNELDIPLFGSLKTLLDGAHPYNKTIFTVIESEDLVERTVRRIKSLIRDNSKYGTGFMFTVPVGKVYMMRDIDEIN